MVGMITGWYVSLKQINKNPSDLFVSNRKFYSKKNDYHC